MIPILIALLIALSNNFYLPLPENVLDCSGEKNTYILGVVDDWDYVNSIPDNYVVDHFPVGDGQVWILASDHVLVFDHLPIDNAYHPCGVYKLSENDLNLLIDTYTIDFDQYDSWQEYWLATHN